MKTKISIFIIVSLFTNLIYSHTINYDKVILKHWILVNENKSIDGSFHMYKDGEVYIEDFQNRILKYPLSSFCKEDQSYVLKKYEWVKKINNATSVQPLSSVLLQQLGEPKIWLILVLLVFLGGYLYKVTESKKLKYIIPIFSVGVISIFTAFTSKVNASLGTITDPLFIDSAFSPFKPKVYTHWDDNYFYVESKGIPDHEMMVGITNWQQQVPIPQCYVENNAWSIPLNPVIAATPVPVSPQHFIRGAIAIAANGVPIFNPYTNTGVDAFLDGQLDNFGGHCGRADDYHYHIAPLSLYKQSKSTLPIAFALDGFAVYGSLEPDSTAMSTLDANHGHYGKDGVYHYHGTATAPYMVGNMVGVVTEDNTMQIIPQAAASPVRPAQTPLKGAVITKCIENGTNNGYTLGYTKGSQNYSIKYSWTQNGVYTFKFINPTDSTTSTYNGFKQCNITTYLNEIITNENDIVIYPNPTMNGFSIKLIGNLKAEDIKEISVYNLNGELIFTSERINNLEMINFTKGVYLMNIHLSKSLITKKLFIL